MGHWDSGTPERHLFRHIDFFFSFYFKAAISNRIVNHELALFFWNAFYSKCFSLEIKLVPLYYQVAIEGKNVLLLLGNIKM